MKTVFDAIIVDDNEVDRLAVVTQLRRYPFVNIAGIYSSPLDALAALDTVKPAIAFLDIDMPGLSGLELRKKITSIKACVFITSYPDYAIESFELSALDFLVKPLSADRFANTMQRLHSYLDIVEKASLYDYTLEETTIVIREGYENVKIDLRDVLYLEALKDYTSIVTKTGKYCVHALLGSLLKEKEFNSFIRIHRSYAIQPSAVTRISGQQAFIGSTSLPIGRNYKDIASTILSRQ